jgi:hypothetical protein
MAASHGLKRAQQLCTCGFIYSCGDSQDTQTQLVRICVSVSFHPRAFDFDLPPALALRPDDVFLAVGFPLLAGLREAFLEVSFFFVRDAGCAWLLLRASFMPLRCLLREGSVSSPASSSAASCTSSLFTMS